MKHLVLVGPMGAGKTTVGREVARRLGRAFVDTDDLVVAVTGHSVADVFAAEGESGFRAHERVAVAEACSADEPTVISCGGGAVIDPDARVSITSAGFVVWLDAPANVLADRVSGGARRPLLEGGDPTLMLGRLRELRAEAYRSIADARIDTEGLTVPDVADAVIAAYGDAS